MNYQPRLNSTTTPSRLTRKQSRRTIYVINRKMRKLAQKAKRG